MKQLLYGILFDLAMFGASKFNKFGRWILDKKWPEPTQYPEDRYYQDIH
jgi:hypothetical protein